MIPWIINQGINRPVLSLIHPSLIQLYNQCQNNDSQHTESIFTVLPAFYIVAFVVFYIKYQRRRGSIVPKQVLSVACLTVV